MSVQENSMVKIDFTLFRGNYSLVACADKSTAKWNLVFLDVQYIGEKSY